MRPHHRPDDVMRRLHRPHPAAHGFVDGVLERLLAGVDRHHLRAQQLHPKNVELLPPNILRPHIHHTFEIEHRRRRRRRHPVLTGPGLGDHPLLAHPLGQQRLAQRVVDLVGPGVVQVLALQINLRPAKMLGQPPSEIQRTGAARIIAQIPLQLGPERRILFASA